MPNIKTNLELYSAIGEIYRLATIENKARVARGEQWLNDFGESGFYVWGEFWEVESVDCYTFKYGIVREFALKHFVAVTEEGDEYSLSQYTENEFDSITGIVEDILNELKWRSENNSSDAPFPKRPERVTSRYSTQKSHIDKVNQILQVLVKSTILTKNDYDDTLYENNLGAWFLGALSEQEVEQLTTPNPVFEETPWVPCNIEFSLRKQVDATGIELGLHDSIQSEVYSPALGCLVVGPERIKSTFGDFEKLLEQLDKTD